MKIPFVLLGALVCAPLAFGGVVIEQEVEQGGSAPMKTRMTIKASGDKARLDMGDKVSSIVDAKTGAVISLMHPQKIAMELPSGTVEAIKQKVADPDSQTKPDIKPTGKKETISGFACEEYRGTLQGMDVTYWVTQGIPNAKEILGQLARLSGKDDPFKAALASGEDFPGFPIRTTVNVPQLGPSTMTVLSVKTEDLPAATFTVPDDYKTMGVPQMSSPGGGAPALPAGPGGN